MVIARNGDTTTITMANDYQGDLTEFALVVPVPEVLARDQIAVSENAIIDHLDAYTAPRLVEYFDEAPHEPQFLYFMESSAAPESSVRDQALGVTIEARYSVGEYDILILSAEESSGLGTWLTENGYKVPPAADRALDAYIRQGMKFFVAQVNLEDQATLGFSYLRPLRLTFRSPDFMLPIRLGMVNANGPQELFVYTLTRQGRVEVKNYRTARIPTDRHIPLFVKQEFGAFYTAMFDEQVRRENGRAVFLEYAWDMGWCDPCAADPLSNYELEQLGVDWLKGDASGSTSINRAVEVFVTRLHVRYDATTFPDDLIFRETDDRENYQGRYVLRHPWLGEPETDADREYLRSLPFRFELEAQNLATLTGWPIADIRAKMKAGGQSLPDQ